MKDEELEIEEPTGKFILDNLPFEKRFQTANGMYVHYSDVCTLLKKYYESKVNKLNKADVSGQVCPKCNVEMEGATYKGHKMCHICREWQTLR